MIKRDFHGWRLEEAIRELDNIIGRIRLERKSETVEIVTGHGIIKRDIRNIVEGYGFFVFEPESSPKITIVVE